MSQALSTFVLTVVIFEIGSIVMPDLKVNLIAIMHNHCRSKIGIKVYGIVVDGNQGCSETTPIEIPLSLDMCYVTRPLNFHPT